MPELSFVDPATGEDRTEAAKEIIRQKAPELLELVTQVRRVNASVPGERDALIIVEGVGLRIENESFRSGVYQYSTIAPWWLLSLRFVA